MQIFRIALAIALPLFGLAFMGVSTLLFTLPVSLGLMAAWHTDHEFDQHLKNLKEDRKVIVKKVDPVPERPVVKQEDKVPSPLPHDRIKNLESKFGWLKSGIQVKRYLAKLSNKEINHE